MILEAAVPKRETEATITVETLRRDHLDAVYAYTSRRLRREDAEDATAETFQAAFNSIHKIKNLDPRLWLLGIARRKVADALRRNSRRKETNLSEEIPIQGESLEQREANRQVRKLVMALPDDQREALLLQHLEELSINEIAVVMGKTPTAINSLLQRARAGIFRTGQSYFSTPEVNL